MDKFKYVLRWLLVNTQGGENRALILNELFQKPCNANELCMLLQLNYKTIRYHLDVLEKNNIIISIGEKYGKTYFPTDNLKELKEYFDEILVKFIKKVDKE
ncbi:ArsR family transcriptional regulator [Candidatus Woesearchaeota archaeon]|jgi:DNA-binding transcriptional ArsR family regulator|nr:ArsR family transcriptional regulator [Candidatus Woesearchaeota archaeon]